MDQQNENNLHSTSEEIVARADTTVEVETQPTAVKYPNIDISSKRPDETTSKSFRFGLFSFITSVCLVGAYMGLTIYEIKMGRDLNSTSSTFNYISSGLLLAASLASILIFSIPSFKKNKYPNLLGLTGLVINLIILITAVDSIVNLLS